jgi:hypothetical protein
MFPFHTFFIISFYSFLFFQNRQYLIERIWSKSSQDWKLIFQHHEIGETTFHWPNRELIDWLIFMSEIWIFNWHWHLSDLMSSFESEIQMMKIWCECECELMVCITAQYFVKWHFRPRLTIFWMQINSRTEFPSCIKITDGHLIISLSFHA